MGQLRKRRGIATSKRGTKSAFRHGVVVSLLSGTASRALLALALVGGTAAAVTSFVNEEGT